MPKDNQYIGFFHLLREEIRLKAGRLKINHV
jgi:hypothetical protein